MIKKICSPLRYPGGKGKLYLKTIDLLKQLGLENTSYIEPYAGGAGLALNLLLNGDVGRLVLNDYDISIYAFWYSILNDKDEFINRIKNVTVTIEEWEKQKEIQDKKNQYQDDLTTLGFSTFFLNRTNRSGILKGGVLGGKDQKGKNKIDCRFNKEGLISRIDAIYEHRDKITLMNMKAEDMITDYLSTIDANSFIFFDPPYYKKGPGLYTNFYVHEDHVNLEQLIDENISIPYIITYDNNEDIESIYSDYNHFGFDIRYSAKEHKMGSELLIYKGEILDIDDEVIKRIFID